MAKKIIRGGKIYIDSSLLKLKKPMIVEGKTITRDYYEIDLGDVAQVDINTANIATNTSNISTLTANAGGLKRTVVNIGDWNMDTADTTTVAHGLTFGNIRNIEGVIRNDAADTAYASGTIDSSGNIQWTVVSYDATNVTLRRRPAGGGGIFDNANFDSTSFNRGWLIIDYV